MDPYATCEANVLAGTLVAYTDAVSGLGILKKKKISYCLVQQMVLLSYGIWEKLARIFT